MILTSDIYVAGGLWQMANHLDKLEAIFVDVSHRNELADFAESSKHLITRQLQELGRSDLYVGEIDHDYRFSRA